jgi:hypothetical protein
MKGMLIKIGFDGPPGGGQGDGVNPRGVAVEMLFLR